MEWGFLGGPTSETLLTSGSGERAVGFGHAVRVFALLDRVAAVVGGIHQLTRQAPAMLWPVRSRAAVISQRMASAWARSGRTSTGT